MFGTESIFTSQGIETDCRASMIKFATNTARIVVWNTSGSFCSMIGPVEIPSKVNAPRMIDVFVSPGTPRESMGISAPPTVALLADSGAAIPWGSPVPKVSGSLARRFSIAYPMRQAGPPPSPGRIPTSVPSTLPRRIVPASSLISFTGSR